ncbi:MAG: Veg family protein [Eubacteriales bacterium]|nr:Veg family protein [Eubacteriales bacterium]
MIVKTDLDSCRKDMQAFIGKKVTLKSSGGRKRLIVQEGILESCYPNVFTVRCAKSNLYSEMISYSYVDILTRAVEIDVDNGTRIEIAQ